MNSNGILNQLRPNGYNGEIYNFRASNIFHFKPQTTPGSFPESGESGVYNDCIALRNNLLTSIEEGLILSFIVPEGCSNLNKIYIFNNSTTPLNSEPIEIKISNLEVNKWYLMVYNGSNFSNVNIYPDNRVTYDSENAITSKAVYEYVSSIATSSLSYKICPPEASKIPAGVIYNDGNNTITGTLVADITTEKIIYLVKNNSVNNDSYDEYLTIFNNNVYSWEKIGSTGVNINSIIDIINPHTFTPSGSVSQPTFTGDDATINSINKSDIESTHNSHSHVINANNLSVSSNYTPTGEVSKPNVTATTTAKGITNVGTASSYTVVNEVLILTPSTVPEQGDITINASLDDAPTFNGDTATITSTNSDTVTIDGGAHSHKLEAGKVEVTANYKPTGTVSQPEFTGTPVTLEHEER